MSYLHEATLQRVHAELCRAGMAGALVLTLEGNHEDDPAKKIRRLADRLMVDPNTELGRLRRAIDYALSRDTFALMRFDVRYALRAARDGRDWEEHT